MPGTDVDGLLRSGIASLCLAAAVLHMSAAADHAGMATHVAFFVLVAIVQSALAAGVLWGRPGGWLAAAAGGNLAVAVVWALSRTTGLPVDGTSAPEAIGFKDGISTVFEIGVAAGVGLWWLLPETARQAAIPSRRLASTLLGTGVWALGASGLFAGHTHSAGHAHGAANGHGIAGPGAANGHGIAGHGAAHAHPPHPVTGRQDPLAADAGHDPAHVHPPNAAVAATPPGGGHGHATPDPVNGHHLGIPRARQAGIAPASSALDNDHSGGHEQVGPVTPSEAAGQRHSGTAVDAGHGQDNGHRNSHGSDAGHDRGDAHDAPDDRRQPERDRDDGNGAPSALDDVLKLIRPE